MIRPGITNSYQDKSSTHYLKKVYFFDSSDTRKLLSADAGKSKKKCTPIGLLCQVNLLRANYRTGITICVVLLITWQELCKWGVRFVRGYYWHFLAFIHSAWVFVHIEGLRRFRHSYSFLIPSLTCPHILGNTDEKGVMALQALYEDFKPWCTPLRAIWYVLYPASP